MIADIMTASARRPLLPPFYFLLALILMIALHFLAPIALWLSPPWSITGVVPILLGIALAGLGRWQFQRAKTTVYPFETSARLVTQGLFRWSRNPMYLGMLLALVGTALLLGSAGPLLVLPLFYAVIRLRFIRHEERSLARQFGSAYHEYTRKVRRWL
ncbi:MAG: isoprenylcysteine carboxylmethyltransferase family protein [Gammaproteobacteria bacterium]